MFLLQKKSTIFNPYLNHLLLKNPKKHHIFIANSGNECVQGVIIQLGEDPFKG
jgi:hypothetical protein